MDLQAKVLETGWLPAHGHLLTLTPLGGGPAIGITQQPFGGGKKKE